MMRFLILSSSLMLIAKSACAEVPGDRFTHFMDFTLGNGQTLKDVASRLGQAPLVETGETADHETSLCYRGKNGYVQFSAGEMDGPEHELGGFAISREAPNTQCRSLPKQVFSQNLNIAGLYLGMSRSDYLKVVKDRTSVFNPPPSVAYEYERRMTMEEEKKFNHPPTKTTSTVVLASCPSLSLIGLLHCM